MNTYWVFNGTIDVGNSSKVPGSHRIDAGSGSIAGNGIISPGRIGIAAVCGSIKQSNTRINSQIAATKLSNTSNYKFKFVSRQTFLLLNC